MAKTIRQNGGIPPPKQPHTAPAARCCPNGFIYYGVVGEEEISEELANRITASRAGADGASVMQFPGPDT